jgi:hypothetical protein
MLTLVTQLLGSVSNQRHRYAVLAAFAALVVLAAFLGIDQTDD